MNTCGEKQKVKFKKRRDAWAVVHGRRKAGKLTKCGVYRCKMCGCYHIGTSRRKKDGE